MKKLNFLDLSHNQIQEIPEAVFYSLKELKNINFKGNTLSFDSYQKIPIYHHLVYVGADDWRFCCLAAKVDLWDIPKGGISSCKGLLGSLLLVNVT